MGMLNDMPLAIGISHWPFFFFFFWLGGGGGARACFSVH